jgi:hypothetical protein
MEIKREGNTYELTPAEKEKCYEEVREDKWREQIGYAIEDNIDNLRFSDGYPMEEFVDDCIAEILDRMEKDRNDYEMYNDVVFNVAESNDVWEDD